MDSAATGEEMTAPSLQTSWRSRLFQRVPLAARRSVWALLDQALMSGANFLTVVIVGRAAGADALGTYSLGFTLVMLLAATQESLVSSPYTFYGHRLDDEGQRRLAGSVLSHAVVLMLLACLVLAVLWWALAASPLRDVIGMVGLVLPMLLLREFARKFAFADLRMHVALGLDGLAALIQIAGLLLLASTGQLTATTAYAVLGLSCGVGGLAWAFADRGRFKLRRSHVVADWKHHWWFGRWVFAGVVTLLLHINLVRWLLVFALDASAVGVFSACLAIAMLSMPFVQGLNNVLMPQAAAAFNKSGTSAVRVVVWKTARLVLVGMTLFSLIVFVLGGQIVTWIYGSQYDGNHLIISLLMVAMLSRALDTTLYNGIWALERPHVNVRINVVAMLVTVVSAWTLIEMWGVIGGACGLLIGDLCGTTLRALAFVSLCSERDAAALEVSDVSSR